MLSVIKYATDVNLRMKEKIFLCKVNACCALSIQTFGDVLQPNPIVRVSTNK